MVRIVDCVRGPAQSHLRAEHPINPGVHFFFFEEIPAVD
jgi:hypothetical protein